MMFSKYNNYESMAYRSFSGVSSNAIYNPVYNHFFYSRGVRKVTIGITGLWRPRVQIDVAFLILRCRLFLSLSCRKDKALDCSPIKRERELGLDRRETG